MNKDILRIDPALAGIAKIGPNPLGAANIYLSSDTPALSPLDTLGYANVSPWGFAFVSYTDIWSSVSHGRFPKIYGDGRAKQYASFDLWSWDLPGFNGKTPLECSAEEFVDELLHQVQYVTSGRVSLRRQDLAHWQVNPAIQYRPGKTALLDEFLWSMDKGCWTNQPAAMGKVRNMAFGATYARTWSGIDSMDAACEAASRATNEILERSGSNREKAYVYDGTPPAGFKQLWDEDDRRYRAGLPNQFDVISPFPAR